MLGLVELNSLVPRRKHAKRLSMDSGKVEAVCL